MEEQPETLTKLGLEEMRKWKTIRARWQTNNNLDKSPLGGDDKAQLLPVSHSSKTGSIGNGKRPVK